MAERVEAELLHIKEKREAYSAAVDNCEGTLKDSVDGYYSKVYTILYPCGLLAVVFVSFIRTARNAKAVEDENSALTRLNKEVNSEVEGFQERVGSYEQKLDSFQDAASSLDYFDKWSKNIKSKMYEVSHIMEDICQTEQDEMRVFSLPVFHKRDSYSTVSERNRVSPVSRAPHRHIASHRVPKKGRQSRA